MATFDPNLSHAGTDRFHNIEQYLIDNPITAGGGTPGDPGTGKVWGSDGVGDAIGVFPPGYEIGYASRTTNVSVTGVSSSSPTDVGVSLGAVTFDGTACYFEFYAPNIAVVASSGASQDLQIGLYDGTTLVTVVAEFFVSVLSAEIDYAGLVGKVKIAPSAGSHTYNIKAWKSNAGAACTIAAGAGSGGARAPVYFRAVKA